MSFSSELEFESALIKQLFEKGWEKTVLKNKTEKSACLEYLLSTQDITGPCTEQK